MSKKKVPTEAESRANLLGWARAYGCEADLMKIFNRWDPMVKNAKTPEERQAIAAMAIAEVDKFFGGKGDFIMNIPAPPPPPQEKK